MTRKVLIYRDELLGSSETFIKEQAEGLKSFVAFYAGSKIVRGIGLPGERVVVVNNGTFFGELRELLHKSQGLDLPLRYRLRQLAPSLIHAHFGPDGLRILPYARELHLPLITTFHGYDATTSDEYAKKSFYGHRKYVQQRAKLMDYGTLFVAVSNYVRSALLNQGFPDEKVVVHYTGVDVDKFKPLYHVERPNIVLFVGRLVDIKGCEYVIQAVAHAQQYIPDLELVVLGDGPLRVKLQHQAASVLKKFRFEGVVTQDTVKEWMSRAKVLCVPSITLPSGASEAFGMVFIEAQALGTPVVSTLSGGIPEAVKHGETGFLVTEKDWRTMSEYVVSLIQDKHLWLRMSESGINRVRKLFDLKMQNAKLESLYVDILARNEGR